MAMRVELPKDLLKSALELAGASRARAAKAATNSIIKDALHQEENAYTLAITTLTEVK